MIQTVLGKIDKPSLGNTAPHEHIFIDFTTRFVKPDDYLLSKSDTEKVSMRNLGLLRRNPHALKDNLILNDYAVAREEIMEFKYAGGGTIVDVTNVGLGRTPQALRRLAIDTGVGIIMGCGYFQSSTHPEDMDTRSIEGISEEIVSDILIGVGTTGVKSGVIGEIAVSPRMHPNEEKVIAAASIAQKRTGCGMHIHIFDWALDGNRFPLGLRALDIAEANGANPAKVAINHMDVAAGIDLEYCREVAKRGAYIEFDNFGNEFYIDKPRRRFLPGPLETDINRVRALKALIEEGYIKQLLVSCDVCKKCLLHAYGGWGYDHILTNIVHMMREEGFDEHMIEELLRLNPADFLDSELV